MRAALLALLLAAPLAAAHAAFDQGAALGDGASVHVEVTGAPVVAAGVPLVATVRTDAEGPPRLRLHSPATGAGPWTDAAEPVPFALNAGGLWRVEVEAGGESVVMDLPAWPAAGAFVEPASEAAERGVVVQGRPEPLQYRLVDATGRPREAPADARARINGPDGEALDAPLAIPASGWPSGAWRVEVLAPSIGLVEGARPAFDVLVVAPEDAGVYGLEAKDVPFGWLGALLAVLTTARLWRRSCSQ